MSRFESGTGVLMLVAFSGLALAAPAFASSADDDLQAVKRAVLASNAGVSQARPPAEEPAPRAETRARERAGGPMWFRIRVVEKAGKRGRVSINLPIGLVRSLGDDWPIPSYHGCRKHGRCGAVLGEILRALDSGQSLVEIEDDEASVRVWVD